MMGHQQVEQAAFFYEFSLERHIPPNHLLRRSIDSWSSTDCGGSCLRSTARSGAPRSPPELIIRMMMVGYCFGISSERRLCEEVHLNLAYRWFCRLGLDGDAPNHSTFSKNRHDRFRDSDLLRRLFQTILRRWLAEKALRSMPA
jgi:transposase